MKALLKALFCSAGLLASLAQAADAPTAAAPAAAADANPLVRLDTSMGEIIIELFPREAPETVANFLGLAEGSKPFTDPQTGEQVTRPFYDGLIFHRVIDGFMLQGGDPLGNGQGGPGYEFRDEINARSLGLDMMPVLDEDGYPHANLGVQDQSGFQRAVLRPLYAKLGIDSQEKLDSRLDEVESTLRGMTLMDAYQNQGYQYEESHPSHAPLRGAVAMANAGPNTNGSQFFINLADTPWLSGKHTVFGRVREGMDVVDAIGKVPVNALDRPLQPVTINSIRPVAGQD